MMLLWCVTAVSFVSVVSCDILKMNDTFPALYGPIMFKMFEALGGPPHVITMQSHLWDVSLMFHRNLNAKICTSPERRKPFVESWAHNASSYLQVVREMVGPKPFIIWRTGNRRPCPSSEMCKNFIMDEMNAKSAVFTKELGVERIEYSEMLNPPCRDTIHPTQQITWHYMERLLRVIANNVPEVSSTLEKFNNMSGKTKKNSNNPHHKVNNLRRKHR